MQFAIAAIAAAGLGRQLSRSAHESVLGSEAVRHEGCNGRRCRTVDGRAAILAGESAGRS